MSYEIYADAILHDIDNYERNSSDNIPGDKAEEKKVYWVMGYKEGGAIANILASKLIDQAKDVYAYTFASPMTLYNNSDATGDTDKLKQPISRTGYLARYDSIFNVVNEVDAYCFVMPQKLGFSRYGMTCFGGAGLYNPITNTFELDPQSVSKIVNELIKLYKDNTHLTRIKTYAKDTNPNINKNYGGLYNVYQRLIRAIDIERNNKTSLAADNNIDNMQEFYYRYREVPDLASFINALELNYDKIKRAGYESEYYKIARDMNNADIVNVVNLYDNRKKAMVATGSDLYERYPNYHSLIEIDINNPVPSIFQDAEVWSQFRYGTAYNEEATPSVLRNGRLIKKYDDPTYKYGSFWESGCGIAAPAIVLSYISDKEITPMDLRDSLEEIRFSYRTPTGDTYHSTIAQIAQLYGVGCTEINMEDNSNDRLDGHIRMVRELLKGNPVISITGSGPFGGGHFIVIAGVRVEDMDLLLGKNEIVKEDIDKLKKRTTPITDTELVTKINGLNYEDLAGLRIRVLDPRFRHEYHPINNKKSTMSEDWSIETFIYNGAGKARKFWIYTTNNKYVNLGTKTVVNTQTNESIIVNKTQLDLFNYNEEKYPNNYEEYFKPQKAGDSDEFCNVTKNDEREISYFGKKRQDWKYHSFPGLVSH